MNNICFILLILLTTLTISANEEFDKKIDMKDFGKFYPTIPATTTIPTPRVFSKPPTDQPSLIKGCIKIQNWIDDIPEFRVLFEGEETLTDENGFFTLMVDDSNLQKYRLIIARKIKHIVDKKNTLLNLQLIPDKNYLCYTFKKLGHDQGVWIRESKKLEHKNFIVPKNSIILLVDPKYIDRIEDWAISLAENIIKIPRIVIKSEIEIDRLKRLSAKSLLCLDDLVFHEKIGKKQGNLEAKNTKVKIILP